jgi:hypothetical protein
VAFFRVDVSAPFENGVDMYIGSSQKRFLKSHDDASVVAFRRRARAEGRGTRRER